MATITTNTFLDGGTARTAGEAWTMNGAVLTIRTDTRWHANAPASMTGSIGATTISATLGGGVLIDSTAVRWMPYNNGGGFVPAIGTTITQGGVSGYLLGVWANYTSAPTAVGANMPTSGYIKFREVSGGSFSVGTLTGIGADSTSPDRQGWIEIVQRQAVVNTVPRLGYFRTRGGWFELDQKTSGNPNDVIQIPTNGGGNGTHVAGLWIETGVNSNEYEFYPAILSTWFLASNLSTDIRSKFVQSLGNGQLRIGYDGTTNAGYVPPANCRIRIPSNIGRQSSSASGDANNLVPNATIASRPAFTTTSSGAIDFEYIINDWYHLFASPYSVKIKNSATFDIHSTSNEVSPIELENYGTGSYTGASISLTLLSNFLGGTIKNCKFYRADAASTGHSCSITTSSDITLTNCEFGVITYARSTGMSLSLSQCLNITINNCFQTNANTQISTCFGTRINNLDHTDRFVGVTNSTTGKYAISVATSSDDTIVDGLTFGKKGVISNVNTYLSPFYSINSSNTIFRNAGTRISPLSVQSGFAPIYACHDAGVNSNLKFQRIYLQSTRTSTYLTVNTSKNVIFENIYGTVGSLQTLSINTLIKGVKSASNSVTGGAAVYGTHTFDMFESDTIGRVWWAMNEPTSFSSSFVTLSLAGTSGGFTSGGQVSMPTTNDFIIIESPYYILGHTGFNNAIAPLFTGTGAPNFKYEYDIDTGSGFANNYDKNLMKIKTRTAGGTSGTNSITVGATNSTMPIIGDFIFSDVAGIPAGTTVTNVVGNDITVSANFTASVTGTIYFMKSLFSEIISPSTGFKLKIKITTTDTLNTNAITYLRINTTSTAESQDNLYPLNTATPTLSLSGLVDGTTVVVFNSDYSTELKRQTISGTTFDYNYNWIGVDFNVNILIWKDNKIPFVITLLLGDTNKSIPLSQNNDLIYNSTYTNTHNISFTDKLIILNSGIYNVQEVYSLWKDRMLLTTNAKYEFAFSQVGGNPTGGVNFIPYYTFLSNGWKIRPAEANDTVNVIGGILVSSDGNDPFVNTIGAYTVRINYQQPVQVIAVSTAGGGVTPAEIWGYTTRKLSSEGVDEIKSGLLKTGQFIALK